METIEGEPLDVRALKSRVEHGWTLEEVLTRLGDAVGVARCANCGRFCVNSRFAPNFGWEYVGRREIPRADPNTAQRCAGRPCCVPCRNGLVKQYGGGDTI